jgi:hypothetical protein
VGLFARFAYRPATKHSAALRNEAPTDKRDAFRRQQTGTTVDSILQQSRQDTADAAYYRSAASNALFASSISAGAGILKGAVPLFGSGTSGGTGFSLTRTGGLY